ncbi:Alpha/Beta hydrolase protein [Gymnopilus junonius]|uniref:Alpha/Beta hydrolase protein n=1 Tax=Gymnopilus junonius TaxID=109634 RepID=A0A9P5NPL5_GYMJU|nr:Alpha/Beta hydrolase protein [Gymnopilus junonius]
MTSFTSQNSNVTQDLVQGQKTFTATYKIWSLLCLPSGAKPSTVEFAVHGINFDHSYWNFGGEGSQYNYVDAAVGAGHAVFIYDRLGISESSKPDGIKEVQENIEIEVAAELIKYIRRGATGIPFQQIVGIGHSLGSLQLAGVAAKYGNLLNATVLTGFTPFTGAFNTAMAAFGLTIASVQNPSRFKSLESSYLATGTISNDQQPFFLFPFFDPNVLRSASETKQTSTIGEYLTLGANVASNYTNPVLVVTGDKDYIFCGGDCYQPFAGFDNLVLSAKVLFPNVAKFNYSIPANTGHAANLHFGSQNVFKTIQAWISEL